MHFTTWQPMFKNEDFKRKYGSLSLTEIPDECLTDLSMKTSAVLTRDKPYLDKLGCMPYFACGSDDWKDLLVSNWFSAPNSPEVLFLFESDDFIRINKVEWYKHMNEDGVCALDFEDNDIDDVHSEFLVKSVNKVCMSLPVFSLMPMLMGNQSFTSMKSYLFPGMNDDNVNDLCELVDIFLAQFPKVYVSDEMLYEMQIEESSYEMTRLLINGGEALQIGVLPWLLRSHLFLQPINLSDVMSCFYTRDSILQLKNKLTTWSYGECNLEDYDRLVEEAKQLIITNHSLFKCLYDNTLPGRNDLCPCGSGKKFKKCHGIISFNKIQ